MATLDRRERLLVAIALWEWLQAESDKGAGDQRTTDAVDVFNVLAREFEDHLKLIQELRTDH